MAYGIIITINQAPSISQTAKKTKFGLAVSPVNHQEGLDLQELLDKVATSLREDPGDTRVAWYGTFHDCHGENDDDWTDQTENLRVPPLGQIQIIDFRGIDWNLWKNG